MINESQHGLLPESNQDFGLKNKDYVDEIWANEIDSDNYYDPSPYYHDFHRDGRQYESWTSNSEEWLAEDQRGKLKMPEVTSIQSQR